MNNYRFFIDRKVTVWVREWHECESKTLEEAKKKMIDGFHDNECEETFYEQETLYDTIDSMEPGDNGGEPTAELYCDEEDGLNVLTTNIN